MAFFLARVVRGGRIRSPLPWEPSAKTPHPAASGVRPLPPGERACCASGEAAPLIRTSEPSPLEGEGGEAQPSRVRGLSQRSPWGDRHPIDRPLIPAASPWERERPSQQGFTLIEMLVSLTVMAVILMLIGGALRVMGRNWDANAARIETLDMASRAFDLLARDAGNLQRITEPSGTPAYLFSGRGDSLAFVALEPPHPGDAGLYFIAYTLEPNGGAVELVRSRAPYRQGMQRFPGATPANRVPLLTGPYVYRFAYGQIVGGTASWSAEWQFANRLPDLIRLDVLDRTGARALGPPMIVRLRVDAELDCLAPKSARCSASAGGQLQAAAEDGAPRPPEGGRR
jgi:general secretion pathway protein J